MFKRKKNFVGKNVLEMARERTAHIFDLFDHVAVSFSGGKDSTVCLHLALEEAHKRGRLPLHVVHFDEEAIHPPTIEYVQRVAERPDVRFDWFCVPVVHLNACSPKQPYWFPWAPEDRHKWCRELPPLAVLEFPRGGFEKRCRTGPCGATEAPNGVIRHPIPECMPYIFGPEYKQVGVIVGIRTQESMRRFNVVTRRTQDNYILNNSWCDWVQNCMPIYDWMTEDVWTATREFGWDYNRTYDVMNAAGVTRHGQRVCPPYGAEPLQGLWQYAVCFPELWDKMIARVEGAATAGRYARTPLYASGAIAKPPNVSWQDAIKLAIEKWPPDKRSFISERLKREIEIHNSFTKDAIPNDKPHGKSGICWSFLYMLAVRGDLKNRKMRRIDASMIVDEGEKGRF